jgi:FMN reductase
MSKLNVVVVSGNLGFPSKTVILAEQILEAIKQQVSIDGEILQLAELAANIGPARNPDELGESGKRVLNRIASADILVAVTPVYKGSYTGLFKHLFDFLDPKTLSEVPVILGATGGGDKHALIVEHQLRPLFSFFGALTIPAGIYASEQNFNGARFIDPVVLQRIEAAAEQAVYAAKARGERRVQAEAA